MKRQYGFGEEDASERAGRGTLGSSHRPTPNAGSFERYSAGNNPVGDESSSEEDDGVDFELPAFVPVGEIIRVNRVDTPPSIEEETLNEKVESDAKGVELDALGDADADGRIVET